MRYETRKANGLTLREFMNNAGKTIPEATVEPEYEYLLEWFWDISTMVDRAGDGFCRPIHPDDYIAWQRLSENIVSATDYDILRAIDVAYVSEMNKEIKAQQDKK